MQSATLGGMSDQNANPSNVNGPSSIPEIPTSAQLPRTAGQQFIDMIRAGLPNNEKLRRKDIPGCEMED